MQKQFQHSVSTTATATADVKNSTAQSESDSKEGMMRISIFGAVIEFASKHPIVTACGVAAALGISKWGIPAFFKFLAHRKNNQTKLEIESAKLEYRKEENKQKHKNKMEEINLRADRKDNRELLKHRLKNQPTIANEPMPQPVNFESQRKGDHHDSTTVQFYGFKGFPKGGEAAIVAPTDCGKSVLARSIAAALASGAGGDLLTPEWELDEPMHVLLIDIEHDKDTITSEYKNDERNLGLLNAYYGARTCGEILNHIEFVMNGTSNAGNITDLIVIIDNYSTIQHHTASELKHFDQKMRRLQQNVAEQGKSLTIIKLLHTDDNKYRVGKSIELEHIRGSQDLPHHIPNIYALAPIGDVHGEYVYIKTLRGCFITIVNLQEACSRALPFLR